MTSPESTSRIKIIVIGDSSVGKTALLKRFLLGGDAQIENMTPTPGPAYKHKTTTIRGKKLELSLWDTGGMERFQAVTRSHYRDVHGALLVYDASAPNPMSSLRGWYEELEAHGNLATTAITVIGE
ncbi:hypothetical protein FS837_007667 [Tulasnella sp. UAMH 9824]|nr:hypothetical protein FS837_007667 [Tulasnella sp. UAMH 9824]